MMWNCLLVGIGGFAGSVCRYLIGLLPVDAGGGFPIKTLVINVLGAFVIGLVAAAATRGKGLNPQVVLLLKTGLCGGFTTFSTFAYETVDLMKAGNSWAALLYVCLSVVLGVAAVMAAEVLMESL